MNPTERRVQAMQAKAALVQAGATAQIDALARAAFARMWQLLASDAGMAPRDAIHAAQVEFGGGFAEALSVAFSKLLTRSIGTAQVLAMPVGPMPLSSRLYAHAAETTNEVAALVQQHALGVHQARELSMRLYDGYNPQDGVRRPLEGRARADLPKALRTLTDDLPARRELTALQVAGQQQAARLKSAPLRAAYSEAFEAWKDGAGQDAMRRKLQMAQREKNRYFANRIAQTELARAHQARVAAEFMADETIDVLEVRINPKHPKADICDVHARANLFGLGPGCYPKARTPRPPYHSFCWCRVRSRPDLEAAGAREVPGGEAAYLRSLPPDEAGRVMGSKERAARVMDGASVEAVTNAGKDAAYRLARVGDGAALQHALIGSPAVDRAAAAAFVTRSMASPRTKKSPFVLSPVADAAIVAAKALGVDLSGKSLAMDHDGAIHAMKGHSGSNEFLRGQVPISAQDLAEFDIIFNAAELRIGHPPKASDGTTLLEGSAGVGEYDYTFAARVRRLYVVPQTLFKRRLK